MVIIEQTGGKYVLNELYLKLTTISNFRSHCWGSPLPCLRMLDMAAIHLQISSLIFILGSGILIFLLHKFQNLGQLLEIPLALVPPNIP